MSLIIVAVVV